MLVTNGPVFAGEFSFLGCNLVAESWPCVLPKGQADPKPILLQRLEQGFELFRHVGLERRQTKPGRFSKLIEREWLLGNAALTKEFKRLPLMDVSLRHESG